MSKLFKSVAFPIVIVIVLAFFALHLLSSGSGTPPITWNEFRNKLTQGQVTLFNPDSSNNSVTFRLQSTGDKTYSIGIPSDQQLNVVANQAVASQIPTNGSKLGGSPWWSALITLLPFL